MPQVAGMICDECDVAWALGGPCWNCGKEDGFRAIHIYYDHSKVSILNFYRTEDGLAAYAAYGMN